jgi:hypothetical protein
MKINDVITEASRRPQKPKPYNSNPVAKHMNTYNKAVTQIDKKKEMKKKGPKIQMDEGPLVLHGESGLINFLDRFLDTWKGQKHSNEEYAELLKVLGKNVEFDGKRVVITSLEEGNGNIRKMVGAAALIAALGIAVPDTADTPLGKELQAAASAGDAVAEYHLDNLDFYMDAGDTRTMINLKIAYIEDSPREDVKAYLAKKAGINEATNCWKGYKKDGTKPGTGKNKGKRVNNCVPK